MLAREQSCPACGRENACRIANGCADKGPCWCEAFTIPAEVQRRLAEAHPVRACLCRECLARFGESSAAALRAEIAEAKPIEGEDFYLDEFGRMVFTAAYHLKRGHCCDSGCRHCPYPAHAPVAETKELRSTDERSSGKNPQTAPAAIHFTPPSRA